MRSCRRRSSPRSAPIQSKAGLLWFYRDRLTVLERTDARRCTADVRARPHRVALRCVRRLHRGRRQAHPGDTVRSRSWASILIAIFGASTRSHWPGPRCTSSRTGSSVPAALLTLGFPSKSARGDAQPGAARRPGRRRTRSFERRADDLRLLAALGLPGLAGFAGEVLILTGVYAAGFWWVALIALIPDRDRAAGWRCCLFQTITGVHGPKPRRSARASRPYLESEGFALVPLVIGLDVARYQPARGRVVRSRCNPRCRGCNR